jgi:hypothetical protein
VAGYTVSVACLLWVFHGVDLHAILTDFASLEWSWVSLAVGSDISVYLWQAWRWNLLLRPVERVPLGRSVLAIYVALFANELLPLRPGEYLIRPYLQAHWSKIPFSVVLSSIIVERVFDGIWLGLAFALTTLFIRLPGFLVQAGRLLGVVVVAMVVMLALVMFHKQRAKEAVPETPWGRKLEVLMDDLHLMGRSQYFYWALLASLPYLLFQILPIYALMRALSLDLGLWPATVLLVIIRLGTLLPQAPGNVGSFQALTVLVLGWFGVAKTAATAFSVMVWAVITLPLLVVGFLALALTGMKFGELKQQAERAAAPVPAADSGSR